MPSNRLAAQSSAQLEDELAKFRHEWKMELLNEQKEPATRSDASSGNSKQPQRKSNRMEHHQLPRRSSRPDQSTPTMTGGGGGEPELNYDQPRTNEEKAKYLFDKAVQLEQQGRHYEAIKFYRMAMQLDADIEFKLASNKQSRRVRGKNSHGEFLEHASDEENESADPDLVNGQENTAQASDDEFKTLYDRFSQMAIEDNKLCQKNSAQKVSGFTV